MITSVLKSVRTKTQMENWRYTNALPHRLITKTGYEAPGVKAGFISHLTKKQSY